MVSFLIGENCWKKNLHTFQERIYEYIISISTRQQLILAKYFKYTNISLNNSRSRNKYIARVVKIF